MAVLVAVAAICGVQDAAAKMNYTLNDTVRTGFNALDHVLQKPLGNPVFDSKRFGDRLFLSAVTSEGKIFFPDTVAAHCARVYLLDDGCGLAEEFLHTVRAHAVRCGLNIISCPDALIPSRTQAVLVPSRGVGFLAGTAEDVPDGLSQRHIRLDVLPDPERQRTLRRAMRSDARQQQLALERAVEQLRMAALLHNELEAVYRPCMDFDALSAFTERYLKTFPGV